MTESTAERYLELMGDDERARLALLACSAALRLDDGTAREAIQLVAGSNGDTERLLRRIKELGCTWIDWNDAWYLAEDVRSSLAEQLEQAVLPETYTHLRKLLASKAEARAASLPSDGQVTAYEARLMHLEAGFQRVFVPEEALDGVAQLAQVWRSEPTSGQRATAAAVDYLAPEIERRLTTIPPEVLFLRGMAARERGDRKAAEQFFRMVWEQGRPGDIFAIAAHLFGHLTARRDRKTAERAFHDSIDWNERKEDQGQVWHSLGNLLARDRGRWREAEQAFRTSLDLDPDARSRGETWHSLGNLLARDRGRWREAEQAFRTSLELRTDREDQGQVWHSLGNLLARDRGRWREAEQAFRTSLELRINREYQGQVYASWADMLSKTDIPSELDRAIEYAQRARDLDPNGLKTLGVAYRVLGDSYERQGRLHEAIEALEMLFQNDRRLGHLDYNERVQARIELLRARLRDQDETVGNA